MTLTIELTPAEEARLQELAAQAGVTLESMAAELIGRELFFLADAKRNEPRIAPMDSEAAESTQSS